KNQEVITQHCRRQNQGQSNNGVNEVASGETLAREQPGQRGTSHERNERCRRRDRKGKLDGKPIDVAKIHFDYLRVTTTAMMRKGPPLPPLIFIGRAITENPRVGSLSRLATFSKAGMSFAKRMR